MTTADIQRTTLPATVATPRPVVSLVGDATLADSRDVARFFGKQHRHVLEAIRGAKCSPEFRAANFRPFEIKDLQGVSTSHVLMTKNGFSFVVLAFTGERAARFREQYIEAFDAMEAELRRRQVFDPNDAASLRHLLLGYTEKVIALEAKVEETTQALTVANRVIEADAPKVEAYDYLLDGKGTCNLANAARILGAEQKAFFAWLRRGGYVFDQGDSTLPRADLRRDGHFKVRLVRVSRDRHVEQTLVTRQGLVWLTHRWAAKLARETREAAAARIQGELGV